MFAIINGTFAKASINFGRQIISKKEGKLMVQVVKATDKYESQLFQWDVEQQIISLPHGKEIWFVQLCESGEFRVVECVPKPK